MSALPRPVDVVIPVYRGVLETRRCIESALATRPEGAEIVVIDDASPEPEIVAWLDAQAASGRLTLLRNERNRGFVATVNRGMALHPERDVVLLNSDTEVANDWLERLGRAAHAARDIATATPFSNNATIGSYPFEGWTGGVPGKLGLARLDSLCAASLAGQAVDIPTAVGFCMYIRRDALRELGPFDEARFGRGYGEENDFCMRALAAGWRHVLACDAYVFHEGSVSFSTEREALAQAAMRVLLELHPDYLERVMAWIARDPARDARATLDAARIAVDARERGEIEREHALERARRGEAAPPAPSRGLRALVGGVKRRLRHLLGA